MAAIAAYRSMQVAAGRPCAAIAWMAAAAVGGALAWGLGQEHHPYGYVVAGFQLVVGLVLLPSYLRRSACSQ
jgi:hypothetical protein